MVRYLITICFFVALSSFGETNTSVTYQVGYISKSYGSPQSLLTYLEKSGISYQAHAYPAKRLYRNLKQGHIHIWAANRGIPGVEEYAIYGDYPIGYAKLSAFTIKGGEVSEPSDLIGTSVVLIQGYTYLGLVDYFEKHRNSIDIHYAPSRQSAYAMLKNNRATYLLDYNQSGKSVLETFPIESIKSFVLWNKPVYLVFSKKTPNLKELMHTLNEYNKSLKH